MNWLTIVVIGFLAWNIVWGYYKGFLLAVYSLISWIVALAFATWINPYVSNLLIQNMQIDEMIKQQTMEVLQEKAVQTGSEQELPLPGMLSEELFGKNGAIDLYMESSGVYDQITTEVSNMVIRGVTYLLVLLLTVLLLQVIARVLKMISDIGLISGINKKLGFVFGGVKGITVIWIVFAGVALIATTQMGLALTEDIYESSFLKWFYENNPVLGIMLNFIN